MAYKILNNNIIDDSRNIINAANVGIGTTNNTTAALYIIGNTLTTGIITASQFVSNVAQGTAPISVASSTLVTNLNTNYLNGQPGSYYNSANNLTGTAPGSVISQSNGLTVTGNLNVSGNVSVAGSSFLLNAQQLRIADRDITLGVTTDANGNDVSTDTTANHGGISIASTEGSPILNVPFQAGINTDPSTYKQIMWIKQGNYSGMGTDAWTFNYAVSIGNTASVQNLSRLTVGAGFTVFDTYLDATDIRARNITAVNNINASGIVTAANGFNATSSSDYKINGTSVLNSTTLGGGVLNSSLTSVGILPTLNATNITNTNINSGGIHTAATYYVGGTKVLDTVNSQVSLVGIATLDATTKATLERELAFAPNDFDSLNVSGISTLRSTTIIGGGTSTGTANQVLQVSGISSGAYIGGNLGIGSTNPTSKLYVVGDGYFTGIVTATTFIGSLTGTASSATNLNGGAAGNIHYQSAPNITAFLANGTGGFVLQSNGVGAAPSWVPAAPAGAVTGLTIRDFNSTVVGTAGSVSQLTFGSGLTAIGTTGSAGIATITLSSNIVGTSLSISGISTLQSTTLIGGGTLTGTAGQVLQVTGISSGAYIGGNLGIGVTNPTRTLDVNGEIRLRAGLYDSTNQLGTLNQVLSVGAGGSVTWQALSSVGGISGINVTQDDTGIRYPLLAAGTNATTTAQYVDATALVYNTSSNCLGIGSLTPTSKLDIIGDVKVVGIVTASDFNSSSDIKLKTNIQRITNPIEKVLQINGVSFNWKESGKATIGVIAQEVEAVLPELVSDTDPKTVNYNGLIGLLIECVKDQQRQIDELKNK